jgi:kinetochore protein NNF1
MTPEPELPTQSQSQGDQAMAAEDQQQSQSQSQDEVEVERQLEEEAAASQQRRAASLKPGPRAARFQATLDSALAHTLGKVSWDNFAACYPTMAAKAPAVLRAVQSQMVERLRALCQVCVC